MRIPRRVPWATPAEIEQVCSWIYTDEHDMETKILAVNRLSAWRSITSLPHALESTLALLSAILQDNSPQNSTSLLSIRHSYAAAVIRLVNGLVDPLQLGAYARSIAAIAAQLGLPAWLVELRHAATHEDLPSLELLREAARESMAWLLHNYFLPTLNPSSALPTQSTPLRPLAPLLKRYKSIIKLTARDVSLKAEYQTAIASILRDIERWVAEAKVSANVSQAGYAWDDEAGEPDVKERWALDRLCDELLEKGALVPLSRKKRVLPTDAFLPPKFSVTVWRPLLTQLLANHPDLPSVLASRIASYLVTDSPLAEDSNARAELSFDLCLARWAMWIVELANKDDPEDESELRKDLTMILVTSLGPGTDSTRDRTAALALLEALCAGNDELQLLTILLLPTTATTAPQWESDDMSVMNQRLDALKALSMQQDESEPAQANTPEEMVCDSEFAPGWGLITYWKPCPMGIHAEA